MASVVLKEFYNKTVVSELTKARGYENIHQVPKLEKITLNSGFSAVLDKTSIKDIVEDLTKISGQKVVLTKATKSISNFKLREGMPIGVKVTLRGNQMWEFLYRFMAIALPNIRDFRGIPNRLDGTGNYSIGIKDHSIFPEISLENTNKTIGLDITIVTSATNDDEAKELLATLGMPFRVHSAEEEN